jgi:hypothetical protein
MLDELLLQRIIFDVLCDTWKTNVFSKYCSINTASRSTPPSVTCFLIAHILLFSDKIYNKKKLFKIVIRKMNYKSIEQTIIIIYS